MLRRTTEKLLWTGDGFSLGEWQVGRPVEIGGRCGVVVSGDGLTITVEWEPRWKTWWRRLSCEEGN